MSFHTEKIITGRFLCLLELLCFLAYSYQLYLMALSGKYLIKVRKFLFNSFSLVNRGD